MRNKSIRHWLMLAVCCGLIAGSLGICVNSLGVFFAPAAAGLGVGRGIFAFHATIANILTGLGAPVGMYLLRKYNFRLMMGAGIVVAGVSTMAMAWAADIRAIYILGALRGFACAFFSPVPVTYVIGNWFKEKHGFAVGLVLSFSGLCGAVFSPLFTWVIAGWGWRPAFAVMGMAIIILSLPGVLLFFDQFPSGKNLLPYGGSPNDVIPATEKTDSPPSVLKLISTTFLVLAVFTFFSSSLTGYVQHLPGYAESLGGDISLGALMVSLAMIGNNGFKLLLGFLSDRIGPVFSTGMVIFMNLCALLGLTVINPTGNLWITGCLSFLYGGTYAVGAVGVPLLTRHIFGNTQFHRVYQFIAVFGNVGAALALGGVGFAYDVMKTYTYAMIGGIVMGSANLLMLVFVLRNASKFHGRKPSDSERQATSEFMD